MLGMKKKRGLLAIAVMLLAVLVLPVFSGTKAAAVTLDKGIEPYVATTDDGSQELSGIKVKMTTDKESYSKNDTALLTLEVTNTNDYDVTNVKVKYSLPGNFKKESGSTLSTIDKLKAGETQTVPVKATVTEDSEAPLVKGAYTMYIVIGVIAVVVIVLILVIVLRKKKGAKKAMSLLLVLTLTGGIAANAAPLTGKAEVTTETGNYTVDNDNFISRVSVHDPSVVKDPKSGMYYIFGSHRAFAKSKDLMQWEFVYTNIGTDMYELFKHPWDDWAGKATTSGTLGGMQWAPDVIYNDTMKKWCMYMSINGDNWVSSICLLTADNIEGPYKYEGVVVYSGINNPKKKVDESVTDIYKVLGEGADLSRYASTDESCINAIDPNIQEDENGDLYMTYGSWSAGIFQLKLDKSTGLRDYNTKYETKKDASDAYLGTKIAGGYYCSGEGPYILKTGKYYYLFLSYAGLQATGGYQMRIYRSENISGPYVDQAGNSAIRNRYEEMKNTNYGIRIFDSYDMYGLSTVQVAQGHNSAFVDDDGKIYLVYHTRFESPTGSNETHQVRVHQMFVNEDGWLVAAPYEYSGETISEEGYAMEDMTGTYEFIYHEPTTTYNVVNGAQLGIVGRGNNVRTITGSDEITIGKHISTVSYSVDFTKSAADTITLNADGTVTGDYKGTWKYDKQNMTIDLGDGKVYKGVFLKQANETAKRAMTMTFTAEGDNVTVWGVKPNGDEETSDEEE